MLRNENIRMLLLLLLAVGVVLGFFFIQQQSILSKSTPQPTPTPIAAASGNILVTVPYNEDSIPAKFLVRGKVRIHESNVIFIRVSSALLGKTYYTGQTSAYITDKEALSEFAAQVQLDTRDFSLRPNDKLTLEVFQIARDGSEIDNVTIPLYFSPELP